MVQSVTFIFDIIQRSFITGLLKNRSILPSTVTIRVRYDGHEAFHHSLKHPHRYIIIIVMLLISFRLQLYPQFIYFSAFRHIDFLRCSFYTKFIFWTNWVFFWPLGGSSTSCKHNIDISSPDCSCEHVIKQSPIYTSSGHRAIQLAFI